MKQQWIFFALVFFSLVSTDDNCYKKNLCYGRDSGALCANATTLVGCSQWQDYPVQCTFTSTKYLQIIAVKFKKYFTIINNYFVQVRTDAFRKMRVRRNAAV